jgi:hypothetical protein
MQNETGNTVEICIVKKYYFGECIQMTDDGKQKLIIIKMKPPSEEPERSAEAEDSN